MKRDQIDDIATALAAQFHTCRQEADAYLARTKDIHNGGLHSGSIDDFVKLVRMNAQLAGVIARLDAMKNRNSKTQ